MGCGVLDVEGDVPGTTIYNDDPVAAALAQAEGIQLEELKFGTGKNSHIILVPQPSASPNDPYNWSYTKRWTCFMSYLFAAVISGVAGPLLSPAQLLILEDFNISLAQSGQATAGWLVFGLATAALIYGPLIQKVGRRPVFLWAGLCMAAGSFGAWKSRTYPQLLISRLIIGFGMGPAECLTGAAINDLFHVHERGLPIALYNLAVVNGINITPALSGVVIARHGWRTPSLIFALFASASWLVVFFFQPETLYLRPENPKATSSSASVTQKWELDEKQRSGIDEQPKSYFATLKPWSGIYPTRASVFQIFYRPFLLVPTPIVIYSFFVYGLSIAFSAVLVAVSAAYLFSFPPYNFGPEQSGYIYFAPFVSCFIAAALAGGLSDRIVLYLVKRNHGIYEPEFRLPLMVLYTLFAGFGWLGWGISAGAKDTWVGPVLSFGILQFGTIIGCSVTIGYLVDSYQSSAASALTAVMCLKNYLSFSVSYWAAPWISVYPVVQVFGTIAALFFFSGLLTIPMYVYGKRARHWVSKVVKFEDEAAAAIGH